MTTYRSQGRSHLTLELLAQRPADLSEIRAHLGVSENAVWRREHWYAMDALLRDGHIASIGDAYVITRSGLSLLDDLRLELPPAQPSVRIFSQARDEGAERLVKSQPSGLSA